MNSPAGTDIMDGQFSQSRNPRPCVSAAFGATDSAAVPVPPVGGVGEVGEVGGRCGGAGGLASVTVSLLRGGVCAAGAWFCLAGGVAGGVAGGTVSTRHRRWRWRGGRRPGRRADLAKVIAKDITRFAIGTAGPGPIAFR